MISDFM